MSVTRLYLFDTSLRDGAQTQGVDFSVTDKQEISKKLDDLGLDYIEGGWPGANPTDDAFFAHPPQFSRSRLVAFGMTRRVGYSTQNDPGLALLRQSTAPASCIVGKSSAWQAENILQTSREENLAAISESVAYLHQHGKEVIFDCEHFFDGYKQDVQYSLACAQAAYEAGARWVVLCDTNGGTMPFEIAEIIDQVQKFVPAENLGIHAHNDTENAVANSLMAVKAGVHHIQGTLNGLGERCGNANLVSLIPTLALKMGYDIGIAPEKIKEITRLSRWFAEHLNHPPARHSAYVGLSAFAHKGGLHASAMAKDPSSYEHIEPEQVGNQRQMVISDQAGRSNILAKLRHLQIDVADGDPRVKSLLSLIKQRDFEGYAYDGAEASFELLLRRHLGTLVDYFEIMRFAVTDERRFNAKGRLVTESEARIKVKIGEDVAHHVAEGNGPVHALDQALRKALLPLYPQLSNMQLGDYRVRILKAKAASAAMPRVLIESHDSQGHSWYTVGVSTNIIDASLTALGDSFTYFLFRQGVDSKTQSEEGLASSALSDGQDGRH